MINRAYRIVRIRRILSYMPLSPHHEMLDLFIKITSIIKNKKEIIMLIKTITFELNTESFLIEDTIANRELVLTNRYTRQIEYTKTFDFEFRRKMNCPLEFITMDTWIRLINAKPVLFAMVPEIDNYAYIANG